MCRSLSVLVVLGVIAAAMPAAAEGEAQAPVLAQQLFDEAEALLNAKRVSEACPKYAESYRLDPQLGVLVYLAECYEHNGQLASAWSAFREAEAMALARKDRRLDYARTRINALTPRLSRLTVSVPTETKVEGLALSRNGTELPRAAWGTPTPTDAGSYVLDASAPGRRHWTTSVVVPPEGGNVTVTVPELGLADDDSRVPSAAASPPAVESRPPAPPTPIKAGPRVEPAPAADSGADGHTRRMQQITALALAGSGVVALGVGAVLGVSARAKSDDSAQLCNSADVCTHEGVTLRRDAQSRAVVANVVTGVGVAAIVGGVVLWFTAPPPPKDSASTHARAGWSLVPQAAGWGLEARRAF